MFTRPTRTADPRLDVLRLFEQLRDLELTALLVADHCSDGPGFGEQEEDGREYLADGIILLTSCLAIAPVALVASGGLGDVSVFMGGATWQALHVPDASTV